MPVWLIIVLVVFGIPSIVIALVLAAIWLGERMKRPPIRTEYLRADPEGTSADAARIAMAVDVIDRVLVEQSALFWEDRDDQLNNVLLDVREILVASNVAVP